MLKSTKGSSSTEKEEEEEIVLRKVVSEIDKRISSGQYCPRVAIPEDRFPNCVRILDKIVSESGKHIPCGRILITPTCERLEQESEDDQHPRKMRRSM